MIEKSKNISKYKAKHLYKNGDCKERNDSYNTMLVKISTIAFKEKVIPY